MSTDLVSPNVMTPQFRTLLLRRLKNMFPSCETRVGERASGGVEFQLFDMSGAPRSAVLSIHRHFPDTLTRSHLEAMIRQSPMPIAGYPAEMQ